MTMRCAICVWNFGGEDHALTGLINLFADAGYNAMSLLPGQILDLDVAGRRDLTAVLDARGLQVTVHGNCGLTPDQARLMVDTLGPRLRCLTLDAGMIGDSTGYFYDLGTMGAIFRAVDSAGAGLPDLRFGVEDFPLDGRAREFYRAGFGDLWDNPRYGLLVDIGHFNIRHRCEAYFKGQDITAYLANLPVPLIEVHLHDNSGERDQHKALGTGTLDVPGVAAALRASGFSGMHTIETAPWLHEGDVDAERAGVGETLNLWKQAWERGA